MTLVIPGVEVRVVKEVVAPQLAPSGILGIAGITETAPADAQPVQSFSRFLELYGASSAYSMPEASLALANGVAELIVSPIAADATAKPATAVIDGETKDTEGKSLPAFTLTARARGSWGNQLSAVVTSRTTLDGRNVFDLEIKRGRDTLDLLRNLEVPSTDDAKARFLKDSQLVTAVCGTGGLPAAKKTDFSGGADASAAAYDAAIRALADHPEVDMVLAALQDMSMPSTVAQIYSSVISHCQIMSAISQGRIGFGQTPPAGKDDIGAWSALADNLRSDRFVLLAPWGTAGAVAGMVGSLDYYQSPTFKTVVGLTDLSRKLVVEEQVSLLNKWVVPVANMRDRGTIVVRGLTTDGDQISVRRVADRAVRAVKLIGNLFIGRLNNETGRGALKQKLTEFLVQMERDGAIVPSTDGKQPSFALDVYSTQSDFSQGIVRVSLAVRPVRAIDYIYATVLVQA
nr:phage tail sheath subtilisin-like domain-containing protein [uncultured Rhodopila sp.]